MHPNPNAEQRERLLGEITHDYAVFVHDSTAPHAEFGVLSDGTHLELNPLLNWPERILLVGSVEPHFFAGFTGGAKQILPGLASKSCIEANHRHAVHPHCRALRLSDNPVAMAIRETALRFASRLLSIQAVEGPDGWETFWGGEPDTFERAAARAGEVAQCLWDDKLDGLIAVVQSPLDRNLYQLQKGFENHLDVLKPGGFVLLISACFEGVGNDFFGKLAARYPDWRCLPDWESQEYSLGLHKLYRTAAARQEHELYLYSQLPSDLVRSVYLEPVDQLQPWIDQRAEAGLAIGVINFAERHVSTVNRVRGVEWSMEEQRYG
jgi:lactate racemase